MNGKPGTSKFLPIQTRGSSVSLLLSVALNCRALPTFPVIQRGLLIRVPLLLLPDKSAVVVPLSSSNAQYPVNPFVNGEAVLAPEVVVKVRPSEVATFPAISPDFAR